ncbi:hypothetical protein MSAN_01175600 [Mycena sanguinolenta]|uniref:F-box domain-containing protein n=1 Tax=Mycena sanguinolenta TaxID=230812 RepID=A0A8H6YHU5_9AGAR|nr:hypothetical protein MSAN_01175600 [Mycena sanguinolenta]
MQLPNELILLVCSYMSNESLWALTQVSSRIRSITLLDFLARHHISKSDIKSGTITLRSHLFLILVIAHLHPIQTLTIAPDTSITLAPVRQVIRTWGGILSATSTIPEILVEPGSARYFTGHTIVLYFLAHIPQTDTRIVILIADGPDMHASRPRKTRPIRWQRIPSFAHSLEHLTPVPAINYLLAGILFFFIILICSFINCTSALVWLYRWFFGPAWDREARLRNDLWRHVGYGDHIRVQTTGTAFTFLTIWTLPPRSRSIRPVSGLGDDELSAAVSDINLNPLLSIWIEGEANIRQSDFHVFLHNHPDLKALGLRLNAIRPSSLRIPDASAITSIVSLSAPALYIPHLIPIAPLLTSISIDFHPTRAIRGAALNIPEYRRALDSVGSLAGTHALSLILSFPSDASNFPWLRLPNGDARTPEARLHRVTHLLVGGNLNGPAGFGAETLRALPRWIRLFPALKTVIIRPGRRQEAISTSEQQELLKAIAGACQGGEDAPV